eukprot:1302072-Prymnesium_polylepis.2
MPGRCGKCDSCDLSAAVPCWPGGRLLRFRRVEEAAPLGSESHDLGGVAIGKGNTGDVAAAALLVVVEMDLAENVLFGSSPRVAAVLATRAIELDGVARRIRANSGRRVASFPFVLKDVHALWGHEREEQAVVKPGLDAGKVELEAAVDPVPDHERGLCLASLATNFKVGCGLALRQPLARAV